MKRIIEMHYGNLLLKRGFETRLGNTLLMRAITKQHKSNTRIGSAPLLQGSAG
jgi:hypothetical protein